MTPDDVFLADILANPDDESLRLIFADYLDEREGLRGEFIRLECKLEHLLARSGKRHALEHRARQLLSLSDGAFSYEGNLSPVLEQRDRQLLSLFGARWAAPLAGLVDDWAFRRGFVQEVGTDVQAFVRGADELFRVAPVQHVSFCEVPPLLVPELFRLLHLARLRSLRLAYYGIGAEGARSLAACPYLNRLTALDLTHCHVGDAGVEALLSSPHLAGLRALLGLRLDGDATGLGLLGLRLDVTRHVQELRHALVAAEEGARSRTATVPELWPATGMTRSTTAENRLPSVAVDRQIGTSGPQPSQQARQCVSHPSK
jgi:uncharacterized protein (TIGR02996 family)